MRSNCSMAALVLFLSASMSAGARLEGQVTECSAPAADIITGSTTTAEITVEDDLNITDVKVQVDVTHSFIGELVLQVTSPEGTRVVLMNKLGGVDDNISAIFSDTGVELGAEPFTCNCEMQPYGPGVFADMAAESSSGTWTLVVDDHFGTADGVLNEWCVTVEGCALHAPENLSATAGGLEGEVMVSWENADSYDGIGLFIDGAQVATPTRDATATTVSGVECGRHTVRLEVTSTDVDCPSTTKLVHFSTCLKDFCVSEAAISPGTTTVTLEIPDDITIAALDVPFRMQDDYSVLFDIALKSPAGTTVGLHESGGTDSNPFDLVWSDNGIDNGNPYDCECTMKPSGPGALSDFTGESATGTWSLEVSGFGTTTVNEWCLGVQPEEGAGCTLSAPTDVTCTASGCDVAIVWSNSDDYAYIEVFRDGVKIKTTGGSSTQCLDKPGCSGTFVYEVVAHGRDCAVSSSTCEVTVDFQLPVAVDFFEVEDATAILELPADALQVGSDPVVTTIDLRGVRLGTGGPFELGTTDVVIIRKENAVVPDVPSEDLVPFSLMELSLEGVEPISVLVNGQPSAWRLNVVIATDDHPAAGNVTFFRDAAESGTYDLEATIAPVFVFEREQQFLRGDSNFDFHIDISDPICSLLGMFLDRPSICLDAEDTNDDGVRGLPDVLLTLHFMFNDGRAPATPFPAAGVDPTPDDGFGCDASMGEATWESGAFVISGTGAAWSPLEDCSTFELAVPRLGLGPCMHGITLESEILDLTLVPPQADPDRPPADIDAGAFIDSTVASLGRGATISDGAIVGPLVVVGPGVFIAGNVELDESSLIGADVILGAGTKVAANTIIDAGTVTDDDVIIGADTHIGHDCVLSSGVTIGNGCQIGDGTEIGSNTILGNDVILKGGVSLGAGVTILDGISIEAGYVVEDDIVITESYFTCTEELESGGFIGTIEDCEAAEGAVLGDLPDLRGEGLQTADPPAEVYTVADYSRYIDPLQAAVFSAGEGDPRGRIHLRGYVEQTYDCDDFAGDMEVALEALGYDATMTVYWDWKENPDWRWYNFLWTYSNVNTVAHAVTDVHVDGKLIWIEPQTAEIGVNMDLDGDGQVGYDTELGDHGDYTEGQRHIEVYESRAEAEAAGVQMDK